MAAMQDLAAAPGRPVHEDPVTRADIRDELRAFAEVVLQRHLADLAGQVRKDVREDTERLLKEQFGTARVGHTSTEDSCVRGGAVAWDDDRMLSSMASLEEMQELRRASIDSGVCRVAPVTKRKEASGGLQMSRTSGALREAVLGHREHHVHNRETTSSGHSHGRWTQQETREYEPFSIRGRVKAMVRNVWFERISTFIVLLNCIFVGYVTDYLAQREQQHVPTECQVIEAVFLAIFVADVSLRLFAFRCKFFRFEHEDGRPNPHISWNLLDLIVTVLQVIEVITTPFSSNFSVMERISILRIIRLVRLFRIARLVKVLRFVGDLRVILFGIWRSVSVFFWATLLLLVLNYVVAVYFTDLVLTKKLEGSVTHPQINKHFGSLGSSMLSLFMALNGGRNWGDLTDVLSSTMDFWVMFPFLVYIAFTLYAVLNVITGIFLETAMESARDEKELFVVFNARNVFERADCEGNGTITWPDLECRLEHKDVRRFFDAVDIQISEAKALFKLLDVSGDGFISFDEFIDGCLRVRGPSKSLDLLVLQREVSALFEKHYKMRKQARVRPKHCHMATVMGKTVGKFPSEPKSPQRGAQAEDPVRKAAQCATAGDQPAAPLAPETP